MGGDTCKNDVKTLFFICNSLNAVLMGLLMFSFEVEQGVFKTMATMDIISMVGGLLYIAVGLLGYVGASAGNIKILRGYIVVMCARSICNVTRLVRWDKVDAAGVAQLEGIYAFMVGDTIITMASVFLSLTLAVYATN